MKDEKEIKKTGMDRRSFLKMFGYSAAGAAIMNSPLPAMIDKLNGKPNIIFVLADDLGYGDLGCYGQKKIRTPNIDKMASMGIRFTSCYSGSPVCAPSRNCLMTGQHTGHTTVRQNASAITGERIPLLPTDVTVAKLLKKAGYNTAMIGKWGLGEPGSTGEPNKQGFDYFFGFLNQKRAHNYYPTYLWRNTEKVYYPENENDKRVTYAYDLFESEALEYIDKNKNKPFFLYLPLTTPHAELLVPEDSLDEYKGKFVEDKPFYADGNKEGFHTQLYPHAAYAAMITRMDRGIGRILSKLKEHNIDDNTIVFFTSDNGPSHAGGIDPEFFDSAGPFRGGKFDLYEGGIRIPMIVRWPGKIKPGIVSERPWAFWDFMPTAADLTGTKHSSHIDGLSVELVLFDKKAEQHKYFYWEFKANNKQFLQAVRMGNWKAVRNNVNEPVELYNLKDDISEKNNVADKHPDLVADALKYFKEAHVESHDWPMKIN